jgi:hypothetical protein
MDPNEALRKAREALKQYRGADSSGDAVFPAEELADAFEALDTWLSNGGFLPRAWTHRHCLSRDCLRGSSAGDRETVHNDPSTFNPTGCECVCAACTVGP